MCVCGGGGMSTETQYYMGTGAIICKTGVTITSDVNSSAITTGEIKKIHVHLLLLYVTLEHKTSHKGPFFKLRFMHPLKAE